MGWTLLLSGIAVNVSGVIYLKLAQHKGSEGLSLLGYAAYFAGFIVISRSFKYLDMGLTDAFWSGVGSLVVIGVGFLFFNESISPSKAVFFLLVVIGVAGMSIDA